MYINSSTSSIMIERQILIDFPDNIFHIKNDDIIRRLLVSIAESDMESYTDIFREPVVLKLRSAAEELELSWDKFIEEIKYENRYHIQAAFNLDILENILKRHSIELSAEKTYYRARIADNKSGFEAKLMYNPPREKAQAGRANPFGISYLYLSNDIQTTIFEKRVTKYDYVSIGEFISREKLNIINLRETTNYDPIILAENEELEEFLTQIPFLMRLENDLSMPYRKSDSELEYIPTQYISEFIKSIGYDGVKYRSSLNPRGSNYAFFYPDKFECIKTFVLEIDEIEYKYRALT